MGYPSSVSGVGSQYWRSTSSVLLTPAMLLSKVFCHPIGVQAFHHDTALDMAAAMAALAALVCDKLLGAYGNSKGFGLFHTFLHGKKAAADKCACHGRDLWGITPYCFDFSTRTRPEPSGVGWAAASGKGSIERK